MQNRGGANRPHAEAWNYPDRRDGGHSRGGIFPRAQRAIPRAWLAWPRRAGAAPFTILVKSARFSSG